MRFDTYLRLVTPGFRSIKETMNVATLARAVGPYPSMSSSVKTLMEVSSHGHVTNYA